MNITFLEPSPKNAHLSGGSLYNRFFCESMRKAGHGVRVFTDSGSACLSDPRIFIADALCLYEETTFKQAGNLPPFVIKVILVHVLCSQLEINPARKQVLRSQETAFLRAFDLLIFVSQKTLTDARSALNFLQPAVVIPPGRRCLPVPNPGSRSEGVLNLLWVGNQETNKGLSRLLKFLNSLDTQREEIRIRLRIAGPVSKINEHQSCEIEYCGYLSFAGLSGLFRISHFLVVSSYYESYCMAASEALGQGTPVLNFSEGGVGSFVVQGRNGFHLTLSDHAEFRRIALLALRGDPSYENMRRACLRSWFELPEWRQCVADFEDFMRRHGHA